MVGCEGDSADCVSEFPKISNQFKIMVILQLNLGTNPSMLTWLVSGPKEWAVQLAVTKNCQYNMGSM